MEGKVKAKNKKVTEVSFLLEQKNEFLKVFFREFFVKKLDLKLIDLRIFREVLKGVRIFEVSWVEF